jgi:hypothetical protein
MRHDVARLGARRRVVLDPSRLRLVKEFLWAIYRFADIKIGSSCQ